MEMRLTQVDYDKLADSPAIYQIRNSLTDFVFVSATEKFKTHLKTLMNAIKHKYDRIPKKLLKDFHTVGSNFFVIDILQTDGVTKDNMNDLKDSFIQIEERLYNVKKTSKGGGFEVVANEAYVLDLEGNIVDEFSSVQLAYNSLGTAPHYGGVNTPAKVKKYYRVVTKSFYNENLSDIKSWNIYNDYAQYRSEIYKESIKVTITEKNKDKFFDNSNDLADYLNCSKETIRLILNGTTRSNPLNIRFTNPDAIEKLNELKEAEKLKKELEIV